MRLANHIYAALALFATAACYSFSSQKSKVTAVEQACPSEPPWCTTTECDGNVSSPSPLSPPLQLNKLTLPPFHRTTLSDV